MASLVRQALLISTSRLAVQALMVLSPLVLVRLLSVDEFGRYREFLLYATLLGSLAAFSLPNALLYFVGRQPAGAAGYARRVAIATAVASLLAVTGYAAVEVLLPWRPLGPMLLPCLLYVLLFANLDFWEHLWLAKREPNKVVLYTTGRVGVRTVAVCAAAWATGSVESMVAVLLAIEALRFAGAAVGMRRGVAGSADVPLEASWREMLAFTLPSGLVVCVSMLNRSTGGMAIGSTHGEAELAMLVIGGYVLALVSPLRNTVSDVLMPKLAAITRDSREGLLEAWQRSSVQVSLLLFPVAVLCWRYAEVFLVTAFGTDYAEAAPLMRWHAGMLAIACVDLSSLLRLAGKPARMLVASVVALGLNLGLLAMLVPAMGAEGAAIALLASSVTGAACFAWEGARTLGTSIGGLLPLGALARVAALALLAALVTVPALWSGLPAKAASVAGALAYLAAFVVMLNLAGPPEARSLLVRLARPAGQA